MKIRIFCLFLYLLCCFSIVKAQKLVVAADGSGQFKSIQAAINSLPDASSKQRIIFIKKGIYREKIFIEKHNIFLKGEKNISFGKSWAQLNPQSSIPNLVLNDSYGEGGVKIIYSESREIFRCTVPDDWGASVMNIKAQDVTLENLIVVNDFGFTAKGDSTFICDGKAKITRKDGHQFALRCMPLTQRLTVKNCNFHSLGGDTVSPWDVDNGTFYFKNCTMEGGVDLYCPRGWAYAEDCYFICHNMNAAIWHDGTGNESAKTVLKNCQFVGDTGYKLGRFHRDAQFYLVNCTFSKDMADAAIYKNNKDTILKWETRVNYYNCHRTGGDFAWHKNNIEASLAQKINRDWTLKSRWHLAPQPTKTKSDYGLPKVADAPVQQPRTPSTKGITGKPDTGYTNWKAYIDVKKTHPNITFAEEKATPSVSQIKNIIYNTIDNRQLLLDAYVPTDKSNRLRPAILIIHGGGWRTGNRTQHYALAQRLASMGYVCFTPEYRLSTEALFPAAVHDLKAAIRWVRANAVSYNIDTNKIATAGFSAGGQLSALLGATGDNPKLEGTNANLGHSTKVNAIIDMDGILAFIHPESGEGDDSKNTSAATYWFGYSKIENPELWQEGSALTYVNDKTPPTLFINSSVARMHAGREDYIAVLNRYNIYSEVHTFADAPHSFVQFQPWFEPMVGFIDGFLRKVFIF